MKLVIKNKVCLLPVVIFFSISQAPFINLVKNVNVLSLHSTNMSRETLFGSLQFLQGITQTTTLNFDPTVTAALIAAGSSAFGILIGYWLTVHATQGIEKRHFRHSVLKGIRILISELDDNAELIKNCRPTITNAWKNVRKEAWFFPPIIDNSLETEITETYRLMEMYNAEIGNAIKVHPSELAKIMYKYQNEQKVIEKIKEIKIKLSVVSQPLIEELWQK